jgi:hypothetical protein
MYPGQMGTVWFAKLIPWVSGTGASEEVSILLMHEIDDFWPPEVLISHEGTSGLPY